MIVLWVFLASILAGLAYRLGGSQLAPSWVRDWLVAPILCLVLWLLGLVAGIWGWVALLATLGLTGATISTYHLFLPKPEAYNGFYYAWHGLFIGLAAFPVALATHHWAGWGLRTLALPILFGINYGLNKKKDWLHEGIRGFLIVSTAPLLLF